MAIVDIITICRNITHLPYKYRSSDKFSFTHFPQKEKKREKAYDYFKYYIIKFIPDR